MITSYQSYIHDNTYLMYNKSNVFTDVTVLQTYPYSLTTDDPPV